MNLCIIVYMRCRIVMIDARQLRRKSYLSMSVLTYLLRVQSSPFTYGHLGFNDGVAHFAALALLAAILRHRGTIWRRDDRSVELAFTNCVKVVLVIQQTCPTDGQSPGLLPEDLNHSVTTTERLAETLKVKLIHLRDRTVSGSALENQSRIENNGPACGSTSSESTSISLSTPSYLGHNESAEGCVQLQSSSFQPGPDRSAPTPSTDVSSVTGPVVREYLLRKETPADDFVDVRVAVVGNVDAGKSTLLGVLTHGELDNGRGQARLRLLRHKHEAESGRTSSVSNDILGFDTTGQVVNRPLHGQLDWLNICKASAKVITFIDLAGHERYLKTTIFGMTGHAPDYAMFMVGANAGVIGMAKEHLGLALALGVPVFVVVTKIDMCPSNVFQETMTLLFRILKSPGCRKIPLLISSKDSTSCSVPQERVSNEDSRSRCFGIARFEQLLQYRRFRLFGHVPCRPPTNSQYCSCS
ncbi:GTP-binding protein 1 [Clonorchis sinensis]|uniref:GTP-binding protein 1 n=1 Tax=Clonorchis sinensis TaxID=79923 RepID=G7Y4V5_CLOSI|nr:GTP-binding protein 1 [Clonorchis sinensis]